MTECRRRDDLEVARAPARESLGVGDGRTVGAHEGGTEHRRDHGERACEQAEGREAGELTGHARAEAEDADEDEQAEAVSVHGGCYRHLGGRP